MKELEITTCCINIRYIKIELNQIKYLRIGNNNVMLTYNYKVQSQN